MTNHNAERSIVTWKFVLDKALSTVYYHLPLFDLKHNHFYDTQGTTADDIKVPSAQLQEDGVKIISIGVEADRIQAYTISSIVMLENLVEFLYDSEEKLNRIVNMINEGWLILKLRLIENGIWNNKL